MALKIDSAQDCVGKVLYETKDDKQSENSRNKYSVTVRARTRNLVLDPFACAPAICQSDRTCMRPLYYRPRGV